MSWPTALLLDLDDTIVRDDEAVLAALFATCAAASSATEELFLAVWQRAHSLWERPASLGERGRALGVRPIEALMTESIDGGPDLAGALREYRVAVWEEAIAAAGPVEADAERWSERLRREALCRYSLLPGAGDALAELRERVPLALVTNGPAELQREKLRRLGLEPLFGAVAISAEVGFAKPDPRIFRSALERLGVEAGGAAMVGNDPVEDVGGALGAGLAAVLVCGSGEEEPPAGAMAIGSVAELPTQLSRWADDRQASR